MTQADLPASMSPYFDDGRVALYRGDARDLLTCLPAGSVDLVLTDPPYGQTSLAWDVPVSDWPGPIAALLRPWGSVWCFGTLRSFLASVGEFTGWKLAQDVVWEKHNGATFHADRFRRVHEVVAQFYPATRPWKAIYKQPVTTPDATRRTVRRKRRPAHTGRIQTGYYVAEDGGPRLARSVFHVRSCHGYALHPAQKPLGVLVPLVRYSCPPGGRLLDPFCGAGSSLLAARAAGCRAVGIELDERYCRLAAARLAAPPETLPEAGL